MSNPKLKQARAEIEAIFARYDIAGHVVLHTPGHAEAFLNLSPSYSKLISAPPVVRLRSKVADYHGDRQAQRQDLAATANMVSLMAGALLPNAVMFQDLAVWLDTKLGAEHGDTTFEPDGLH